MRKKQLEKPANGSSAMPTISERCDSLLFGSRLSSALRRWKSFSWFASSVGSLPPSGRQCQVGEFLPEEGR